MLNDIFAASMAGTYVTRDGDMVIERGEWSYRGHDSAEITLTASASRPADDLDFSLEIHSAEMQIDSITLNILEHGAGDKKMSIRVHIAGRELNIQLDDAEGNTQEGLLSVPDETVFMGPSPIWLVHLMMTAPMPADQSIVTPYVALGLHGDDIEGGFYRLERHGSVVSISVLDADGNVIIPSDIADGVPGLEVILTDDGCPQQIRAGRFVTEIVRIPATL